MRRLNSGGGIEGDERECDGSDSIPLVLAMDDGT
jgi:hypothetical protein